MEKRKKEKFRNDDGPLLCGSVRTCGQNVCVYVCTQPVCVCVCVCMCVCGGGGGRCAFVCISSPVDATTHPWQAENTFIFPTLIVKGEVEGTEKECVCVCASVCECQSECVCL